MNCIKLNLERAPHPLAEFTRYTENGIPVSLLESSTCAYEHGCACALLWLCFRVHIQSTFQPMKMGPLTPQDAGTGCHCQHRSLCEWHSVEICSAQTSQPHVANLHMGLVRTSGQEWKLNMCTHPCHPDHNGGAAAPPPACAPSPPLSW